MDARVAQAREQHRLAREAKEQADRHREQRDDIVRRLYAEGGWTYRSLARACGMEWPLVAKIIKPQERA